MSLHIVGFLICAGIIFFAGKRLSYYGDLLAELTGMGKAWVGLILMAAVTSLPELMAGISASAVIESADIAVGNIIGACAINLGVLSMMDIFTPKNQPLFKDISKSHVLASAFGIILMALVGFNLFLSDDIIISSFIGLSTVSFLVVYLIAVNSIYKYQKFFPTVVSSDSKPTQTKLNINQVAIRYGLFAGIIIITALTLPYFANHIADETGLGKSFVGSFFLAISTTLPEIAVSIAAIRAGSTDLAVGNLLGSNLFNILILFVDDIFYTKGHLLKDASEVNLLSVFFVIMMNGFAIIGFIFPFKHKKFIMAWDTFTIFSLYILNMFLLFLMSN